MPTNGSWKRAAVIIAVLIPLLTMSITATTIAFKTGKIVSQTELKLKDVCRDVNNLNIKFLSRSLRDATLDNEITHIQKDVTELKSDVKALSDKLDTNQRDILRAIRDANGGN
jgi:peptidoglycan hydrolase CwlO-like protein